VQRIAARMLMVLVVVVGFSTSRAAGLSDTPAAATVEASETQPLQWLKAGDYEALEQYYSQRLRDYEAGNASDEDLYASFRKLYEDAWDNEGNFDRWVQAYPASYSAVLARGTFLYRRAWSVRGDKYLNETTREQVNSMSNYLARARAALFESLKMSPKPYLSTLYLLNVDILEGSAAQRRHWYELGTAMDPNNSLLHLRYMWSLRPRWGGSYREMEAFLHQCEEQHLKPTLLARLGMLIHADLAEDGMSAGDQNKALDEWDQVLKLAAAANETPGTEAVVGYARAAWDLGRRADADRALAKLSDQNINDAWSLSQVGFIYASEHRDVDAWPLLLKSAKLNDRWAQFTVGKTMFLGSPDLHMQADHDGGIEWIRRSADQCFAEANRFLAAHGYPQSPGCTARPGAPGVLKPQWMATVTQWGLGGLLAGLVVAWMAARRSRTRGAAPEIRS